MSLIEREPLPKLDDLNYIIYTTRTGALYQHKIGGDETVMLRQAVFVAKQMI